MATATPPTDWSEVRTGDEDARFTRYGEELAALAKKRAGSGPVGRALHAKGQLGLRGDFSVLPDIPEHARVGPFASPTTYPAYVRYSNGSGSVQPDGKPDVRGKRRMGVALARAGSIEAARETARHMARTIVAGARTG